jgi:hypothetical protein
MNSADGKRKPWAKIGQSEGYPFGRNGSTALLIENKDEIRD